MHGLIETLRERKSRRLQFRQLKGSHAVLAIGDSTIRFQIVLTFSMSESYSELRKEFNELAKTYGWTQKMYNQCLNAVPHVGRELQWPELRTQDDYSRFVQHVTKKYAENDEKADEMKRVAPHVLLHGPGRIYVGPSLKRQLKDILDSDMDYQLHGCQMIKYSKKRKVNSDHEIIDLT